MIATNCDRREIYVGRKTSDRDRFGSLCYPPVFVDLTADGSSLPELSLTGPAQLVGGNLFPFGTYGAVCGAFLRSIPAGPAR